jgi:hypothetical protein
MGSFFDENSIQIRFWNKTQLIATCFRSASHTCDGTTIPKPLFGELLYHSPRTEEHSQVLAW